MPKSSLDTPRKNDVIPPPKREPGGDIKSGYVEPPPPDRSGSNEFKDKYKENAYSQPAGVDYLLDFQGVKIIAYKDPEARREQEKAIAAQKRGDFALAHQHFLKAKELESISNRKLKIKDDLSFLDAEQQGQLDKLTRAFRNATEFDTARATGGILANTRQGLLSAGLEGGLAESIAADQLGKLSGAGISAQNRFRSDLLGAQNQNREKFIAGEFSFFQAIDMAILNEQLAEKLAEFKAQLEADAQKSKNMWGLGIDIGAVIGAGIGLAVGGPAGAVTGATVGSKIL